MSAISDLFNRIGERIKEAREERGWTQAQLGEALGYSQATIGNYELGRRHVGLDDLYKIADALNKPYSYFLGVDKQVEEQTRREVEQRVRRDMAEFVGVRMLPVISFPFDNDTPLDSEVVDTMMPVPRELAPSADLVFRIPPGLSATGFSAGDCLFLSRTAGKMPGQVFLLHSGDQAGLYEFTPAGQLRTLTGGESPEPSHTVIGRFIGCYTSVPPAGTPELPKVSEPVGWADLDPADQQQVMQFVEFLRGRKGSHSR